MKYLFAVLSALALLTFAVPAFACDGHNKADKDPEVTTTNAGEKTDEGHSCSADCSHEKKAKEAKTETKSTEGEV